ncbi:unnamed protein product [Owenia fusiformis]|uniref:UDP-glucuronosyltransferase n=1 Tax=Owenia fusiformis TaxID=6347 RepID=A0A8J1XUV2_OWEFU|nr:unnamed protein product [Owenia fusiformis]
MNFIQFSILLVLCFTTIRCSKILIMPMDFGYNSRLMNMLKIGNELLGAGHQITVLVSDNIEEDALYKMVERDSIRTSFEVIRYPMPPVDQTNDENSLNQDWINSMIEAGSGVENLKQFMDIFCFTFSQSLKVWDQIANENFDLIIADEGMHSARLISASLDIPLIIYSNWGPMTADIGYVQRFNLAYVPAFLNALTDTMSFTERVSNIWEYVHLRVTMSDLFEKMIAICKESGHGDACDNIRDSPKTVSLVFINRNDALHYPAPFMPHVISLEGFFMDKPKPLSQHYADIIKQAGDNGIIVVSFGSMFRRLWPELRSIFAKAFAAMPQTVIWSYEGPRPEGLGNNTIVNKWIPQQDLMSHPATKLFVTQCGAASSFQALNNALPTIGIPFFWDQFYNCRLLSDRIKSGKTISLKKITSEELQRAMEEVIKDETYKENANKAAAIYHDQPIPPRDKVVYWAEYVIRHKGAPHLRSQAANELNFFQYFLLDIVALVCVVCIIVGISVTVLIKKTIGFFRNIRKNKID